MKNYIKKSNFKFNRNELAGSLGDIGLFVPIVAALVLVNGMNATVILVTAGILYIATGFYFKVPVPVQPLKAVATIAIAMKLAPKVISASGVWMGLILGLIALSPFADRLAKIFRKPVVRGIQFILGIFLVRAGYELLIKKSIFIDSIKMSPNIKVNILIAAGAALLLIFFRQNKKIPSSLVVLSYGLIVGLLLGGFGFISKTIIGPQPISLAVPSPNDFYLAFFLLVLPQIPMTVANSIVATNDLANNYFGKKANKVGIKSLLASLSVSNLMFSFFGGMPLCHGAGGLTAHYRFGSRTAGNNLIIGSFLVILGLMFGRYAIALLSLIPAAVYAALLILLGIQHSLLIKDLKIKEFITPLAMGLVAFLGFNLTASLAAGFFVNYLSVKFSLAHY